MVGEGLAGKGHDVYSIIHGGVDTAKIPMKGIQPIHLNSSQGEIHRLKNIEKLVNKFVWDKEASTLQKVMGLMTEVNHACDVLLHDVQLRAIIQEHHFDLAVVDLVSPAPCLFLLPYNAGIPYVSMGVSAAGTFAGGTPSLPSFVPSAVSLFSDTMDFSQRLYNFALTHFMTSQFFIGNSNTTFLNEFAPEVTSWYALMEKSMVHCLSGDHVLNWPAPSMPNVIRTPGITIKPAKPLPDSLQSIVSSSDRHVVVVTFGSSFANLPLDITKKFVTAFAQVKYTIIWRLGAESSSQVTLPDNVHVVSWLPQNDLLGHPATKLFITHCGNNGQYESVYQGVPMIGFPLFAEQPHNCHRMEYHKLGKCMDINSFDPDLLADYITQVAADDSMYQVNTKKRSAILHDMDPPVETMVRWIEHVMTHGGEHLHSHAVDMPWYQYWMLDVLSFILIVIFLILALIIRIVRKLCCSEKTKYKQQ